MTNAMLIRIRRSRWSQAVGLVTTLAVAIVLWPLPAVPYVISILAVGEATRFVVYGRGRP